MRGGRPDQPCPSGSGSVFEVRAAVSTEPWKVLFKFWDTISFGASFLPTPGSLDLPVGAMDAISNLWDRPGIPTSSARIAADSRSSAWIAPFGAIPDLPSVRSGRWTSRSA